MSEERFLIEKKEYVLLKQAVSLSSHHIPLTENKPVVYLKEKLQRAKIMDDEYMPLDVVRLNTMVTVSLRGGAQRRFLLVMPSPGVCHKDEVSVLSPLGITLLGSSIGRVLSMEKQHLTITHIEQKRMTENSTFNSF
ncbi:transcription elongation factor GreAB [Galbibacter sp. PAP.153]|uniref:GreA/GreB family elongation factor n=1 Tax=Galbibacter sp. PAP.153 TaxID=3104623 RepID=UPI003008A34C